MKVDSMGNEIGKLKTNEVKLESKAANQLTQQCAELCRSKDIKIPDLEGDVGTLHKTHNGSEKKGTLAVQSLRNALMETMLTATVTILIILAMAALTNNTLKVSNLFTSAFFGTQTGKTIVLKYGSASIFLVASFLCSSMALGFLIDANFMVNALGEFSINPRHTETIFERGFTLAFVGDRVLCMTFPLLFWMLGPVPAVVSSLALVWGLRERDFAGNLSRTMSKSCT
ncbi:hypothetical protein CQW23_23792 [Capsicum baccatum]|uniref:Uncharacterized protein n=1 Tax=Capsicum baccatum TaxID=33114 RepID=A0A2G2VT02_CAPBA|nr:hypothetical protein CQW23_23792 [Capsicum baccatum]